MYTRGPWSAGAMNERAKSFEMSSSRRIKPCKVSFFGVEDEVRKAVVAIDVVIGAIRGVDVIGAVQEVVVKGATAVIDADAVMGIAIIMGGGSPAGHQRAEGHWIPGGKAPAGHHCALCLFM